MHKLLVLSISIVLISCTKTKEPSENSDYQIIENPEFGSLQSASSNPIAFELVNSFGIDIDDELIISRVTAFTTDQNSNIYLFDSQISKLISFTKDGKLRFITGQKGRGPGDFESVYSIATGNKYLYLTNLSGSRIDRFDFDGNFISSTLMPEGISFGKIVGFTSNNSLLIESTAWGKLGLNVSIVKNNNDSLTVIDSFYIDQANGLEVGEGMSSSSTLLFKDDLIYSGHVSNYQLDVYDLKGSLLKSIRRDFDKLISPGYHESGGSSTIIGLGGVEPLHILKNGILLAMCSWPTNITDGNEHAKKLLSRTAPTLEFRSSLDVFNAERELLYSNEKEGSTFEIGFITFIDANDIAYVLDYENYEIKQFQIVPTTK